MRIDGLDMVPRINESKRGTFNHFDLSYKLCVRGYSWVLVLGHSRGNVIAHRRKSILEQISDCAIQDPSGPDIKNSRDEWFVFEKIDRADGHVIQQSHSEPVWTGKARWKAGAQDILLRYEAYRIEVKDGPGETNQIVDE